MCISAHVSDESVGTRTLLIMRWQRHCRASTDLLARWASHSHQAGCAVGQALQTMQDFSLNMMLQTLMSHLQAQSLLHTMLVDALHMLQRLSSANDYVVASLMHIRET